MSLCHCSEGATSLFYRLYICNFENFVLICNNYNHYFATRIWNQRNSVQLRLEIIHNKIIWCTTSGYPWSPTICSYSVIVLSEIYTRSRYRSNANTRRQCPRWRRRSKIFFRWYPYDGARLNPYYIFHFGINVLNRVLLNNGWNNKIH